MSYSDFFSSGREGELIEVDPDDILRAHGGNVYCSAEATEENVIADLASHPLRTGAGKPIRIYDSDGNAIQRELAEPVEGGGPVGVFINLNTIKQFFESHYMDSEAHRFIRSNDIDKYQVGHLGGVGCFQTRQPMPVLSHVLGKINRAAGDVEPLSDDDEGAYSEVDEEGNLQPIRGRQKHPVYATHTQAYNLSNHFFAPRANEHRMLHGQVTAAASGLFAQTRKTKEVARKAKTKIAVDFPFEAFESQMDSFVPTALRLESVFVVDWLDVKEDFQTGS
jgi:hypothetical protein